MTMNDKSNSNNYENNIKPILLKIYSKIKPVIIVVTPFVKEVGLHLKQWVLIPLILVLIVLACYEVFDYFSHARIVARFDNAEFITKKTAVYFRGYQIGKVYKIRPSKRFGHIMVYLKIDKSYLKLPSNTIARTRGNDSKSAVIELDYPEKPSKKYIYHYKYIVGKEKLDLGSFIEDKMDSGVLDNITGDVSGVMKNLNKTSQKVDDVVVIVKEIIVENRQEIKKSFKNITSITGNVDITTKKLKEIFEDGIVKKEMLATMNNLTKTTNSLDKMANKLECSIDKKDIKESISNIKESSSNIKCATQNIKNATSGLKVTIDKTNDTLDSANEALVNVSHFTSGTSDMLSQRFLFLRLLFGKPGSKLEK